MTLKFYPKSHRYKLDGEWVPGVTTLIKNGLPKPALMYWSARTVAEFVAEHPDLVEEVKRLGGPGPTVAMLKAVPWQKRDDAAIRGTEVHALAERLVRGEEVDVPEVYAGHVQGYVDWLDREQPEPILTEVSVGSRKWGYAGTLDLVARLRGETWLCDVKTSRSVYGDNLLQLAAYAGAEFYLDADGVEQPMPTIDRVGVLHVTEGLTELYPAPVADAEQAWRDFLHVAWVGKRAKAIEGYLSFPDSPVLVADNNNDDEGDAA